MSREAHRDIFAGEMEWRREDTGAEVYSVQTNSDDPGAPLVTIANFPPGFEYSPHTHHCNYVEYIVDGQITVGKTTYGPGDLRVVKAGAGYGPLKVGASGCKVIIVFERADGAEVELLPRRRATAESQSA